VLTSGQRATERQYFIFTAIRICLISGRACIIEISPLDGAFHKISGTKKGSDTAILHSGRERLCPSMNGSESPAIGFHWRWEQHFRRRAACILALSGDQS
jgi:hypothetical protein